MNAIGWGLRQFLPSPQHACGIPRFAIALYYPYSGMPPTRVIRKASHVRPAVPLGRQVARRGGLAQI